MATTQLQMVNRLLRRLREDTVTGTTDNTYSQLLAEIVADCYEEVLDEHKWEGLKHLVHVDISAGTVEYRLDAKVNNGGNIRNSDGRVPTVDSELLFFNGDMPEVYMYDDDNDDSPSPLTFLSPEAFRYQKSLDRDSTETEPYYFTIFRKADATNGRRLFMEIYPSPTASRVIELMFWTKPARLASDGTTDNVNFLIPERPVFQLAYMYALNERGEELGEPGNLAERRYIESLAAETEKEIDAYIRADRYEWRRD